MCSIYRLRDKINSTQYIQSSKENCFSYLINECILHHEQRFNSNELAEVNSILLFYTKPLFHYTASTVAP